MKAVSIFIFRSIVILALQLFVLNDIVLKSSLSFLGFPAFIPMLYPLLLLLLPVNTPAYLAMLLGMGTGLLVDYFINTPGMHAAACVLLCYMRPSLLRLFFQQSAKELGGVEPTLYRMGFRSFFLYILLAVSIHHLFFYMLQIWSMKNAGYIFFKSTLSILLTLLLIILSQVLFAPKNLRKG